MTTDIVSQVAQLRKALAELDAADPLLDHTRVLGATEARAACQTARDLLTVVLRAIERSSDYQAAVGRPSRRQNGTS